LRELGRGKDEHPSGDSLLTRTRQRRAVRAILRHQSVEVSAENGMEVT
jgi:hypothetical protein